MDKRKPRANQHKEDALNKYVHNPGDPDGVVAAEKQRMWRQGQVARGQKVPYRPRNRWPLIAAACVAVIVGIVGAYFLGFQNAQIPVAKQEQAVKNKKDRKVVAVTTATKKYTSEIYSLSFTYPENWIVSDTVARLTVTSPKFDMQGTDGAESGNVVLMIQNKQSNLPGFPEDGATAGLKSLQLTYKNPSNFQRDQTFLSFVDYDSTNGITKLFLTGATSYEPGQSVLAESIVGGNPLISVSFQECSKSYCASGDVTPISIESGSWDKAPFKPQIIKLLESLVIN